MRTRLVKIGNSKGVIIPKRLIEKYNLKEGFEITELKQGILIKPLGVFKPDSIPKI